MTFLNCVYTTQCANNCAMLFASHKKCCSGKKINKYSFFLSRMRDILALPRKDYVKNTRNGGKYRGVSIVIIARKGKG